MTDNVGVKALLSWVNSIELSQQELHFNDFQDGAVLLKVVLLLKQEPIPSFTNSTEDRFRIVAHFLETECRFNATKGTPLSWNNIKDGINLTVEVAKVLLLLAYHDVMNDRRTLNRLDCDVEKEIAKLTGSFVMENEGYVYLASGLVDYLESKESPVFHHKKKQKIMFVEMETVASSSTSTSPLQNIMNTPKFQLRKLQRQMIKERDYTEGLESELSAKITDIEQKERHINQLQWCLDKLKKEQTDGEHAVRKQIAELENKNDMLRMRLNEILKENKELSSTSSLMEQKMNHLTEENGVLSLQMRTVYPKLAIFEAEIGRLTENHICAEKGWKEKTTSLESKLNEVTVLKESLTEEIEILQGKISQLEDELSSASKEEVGENMGHMMEREIFETEMKTLKNKLEGALCSLNEAELCIQAKTQQLAECQEEMTSKKDLLGQQDCQIKRLMQEQDEMLDKLQQEITGQRVDLQQKIEDLKFRLQQAEQQRCEQISRLQQEIVVQEQEAEKLRQTVKEKEDLISLTEENVKDLNTKFSALSSVLIDKDKQISSLGEEIELLEEESKRNKNELQEKEEMLATLTLEKCNEQQLFKSQIKLFTIQVENLTLSLKQAEQETQNKQDLLVETQKLNVQQQELLKQDIAASEKHVQKLNEEMHAKNELLAILKNDCSCQVELLEKEITVLKGQLEHLNSDLRKAEEQLQNEKVELVKHEKESTDQIQLLQQRLATSEDEVRATKEEIFKQEDEITTLQKQSLECSQKFNEEIDNLQNQIHCLWSSLRNAEENVQSKENLFAEQTLQASRDMEVLRVQMVTSCQEVEVLNAKICDKEKQILLLKTENASNSKLSQQEIETLNKKMQAISNTLDLTHKELQTQKEMVAKLEQDSIFQKELWQQQLLATEEEVERLKKDNQSKEEQLSSASSTQLDFLHQHKEQEILQMRKDHAEQVHLLQQQLALANTEKQAVYELQLAARKENEVLMARIGQAEKDRRSLEKQLEALFIQAKESTERKLETEERYKAQVEMKVSHDNNKMQMERRLKADVTENKMLQLDLDKAQTSEKKLNSMVASFEAQKLQAQNEAVGNGKSSQLLNLDGPSTSLGAHNGVHKKRAISSDSLEQSSLEDPLNNTRYFCTPDESSTPCGCSPEKLAKHRGFCAESPETSLYLTPTGNRNGKENKMEFVSGWKTPASSVKRRRTTQVISITMAKKTPGNCDDDDTFGSLASAASHPNLSSATFVRPVPMEAFDTPAKKMPPTGDQLIGLPGYRRSAVYPNSTSTFCVGAENEPDGSEDWMRIAELQARNKACLPHLKSSYPVEFDTGSTSIFTDEELRTGDPSDTIRRASMMPGQLKDSLTSHRLSLMMANSGTTASTRSHRLSLMPGPLPSKNISLTQLRRSKDRKTSSSMASILQTSPEKMKTSCFPRPLTPKNKNMLSGPSSSILHPSLSPAERRQSMMFTIDNTPKNRSYLKKGLNKLRRSTRKSPCKSSKSPAQMAKNRGQENMPTMNSHTAVGRAGRNGKSSHLVTKS